jgi:hypothetical protein
MMRWLCVLLAACWTGSTSTDPQAPSDTGPPSAFEITLERTRCFGECPAYVVSIDGDGRVRWRGNEHVNAIGERRATVPQKRVRVIESKLEALRFFERDANGELPSPGMVCETHGTTKSCSFSANVTICSHTSTAIVTVRRGATTHRISNDHCDPSPLDELEAMVDDIARTTAWIGERIVHPDVQLSKP